MSEEVGFSDDVARYIDEQERYRWFKRQAIVCQGCLNLDWYYTRRCVLGKIPCNWNHCCWLRVEAVIVKGLEVVG